MAPGGPAPHRRRLGIQPDHPDAARLPAHTGALDRHSGGHVRRLRPRAHPRAPRVRPRVRCPGRRVVVIPAAVLSLLASVALAGGGHTLRLLFAGRFLAGVSSGAAFGAATAWVRELSRPPYGDAGDHVAARRAAVAMTFGFALGPLVAGVLAQWAPLPLIVPYLPHLLLMVVVLAVIGLSPETVTARRRPGLSLRTRTLERSRFRWVVGPMAP